MNTALDFLSAMKQISPTEWAGPCPFCGDGGKGNKSDRFKFWTNNERGTGRAGRYWCRQCGKSGDGVQLVREVEGVSYHRALELLGVDAGPSSFAMPRRQAVATATVATTVGDSFEGVASVASDVDVEVWRRVAAQFLSHCQSDLMPGAVPSEAVTASLIWNRHICPATAISLGLGYYSGNKYVASDTWGIDANATKSGKIRIPGPGIVISSRRDGQVVGLYVHFDKPETDRDGHIFKGRVIRGSAKDTPFIAGDAGKPCFVLESALDAALVWQESRGRVSAIGMNGGRKPVDDACMQFISKAPFLVLCGDNDPNKAGDKAMAEWRRLFSSAVPCFPQYAIGAKDVGAMHHKAMTLDAIVPTAGAFVDIVLGLINKEMRCT